MSGSVSGPAPGEIWPARLDSIVGHEQGGERPCLVISDDRFNQTRAELVIVIPVTRTDLGSPLTFEFHRLRVASRASVSRNARTSARFQNSGSKRSGARCRPKLWL